MILPVTEENLSAAAVVHAISWQEAHRAFCSPAFVAAHTPQRQQEFLRQQRQKGCVLWLLYDPEPVGLVSVSGNLIEHLYVLPEKQRCGYGTQLLQFAVDQCRGTPTLWVLSNNTAFDFYCKFGFVPTGTEKPLSDTLSERELIYLPQEENHVFS